MINSQLTHHEVTAMLQDIELRVSGIRHDLDNIDLLVEKDIVAMVNRYSPTLSPAEQTAFVDAFRNRHIEELRGHKRESLSRKLDSLLTQQYLLENERKGPLAQRRQKLAATLRM